MPISKVEHELWNIFTYYTLHSDPTQPEHLKVAHFLRFAKDCQIVSRHLMAADIQIMMTREVRNKRSTGGSDGSAGYVTFYDFISLINMLAPKVYPECSSPEVALRRLLLENVLLLAGRRIPADMDLDVTNAEAVEVMKVTFGRAILNIYKHYADMADRRRSQEMAAEKSKTAHADMTTAQIKEMMKRMTNTIGYVEFFKFTHDFKLKSTALLTAIQVGDIFLTSVPLDEENRDLRIMNFDTFCSSIILMALVAYRDSSATPAAKVKALLLFMWRSVNSSEKTAKAVNDRYGVSSRTVQGHAGSLNIHGSGLFSDMFLHAWQSEGFPNYVSTEERRENSEEVLQKVVSMHETGSKVREEVTEIVKDCNSPGQQQKQSAPPSTLRGPVTLYGYQIAELFLRKPELSELIYLEIANSNCDWES
mmetsp:Transcript_9547/g.14364  ORF Transcript_9547/g.14364 Transcript_9547/m.14364 type:complete len:421 (-) Transcript_9547:162-1424(-)|eukprot:CAMPEP_0185028010 /NCGR_PEP_ID=MMETSP1103-20130426/13417_1 /TAXON_ID=36769 /ORGANISM="Paraphysomonas bandaiensis, Strain Caron Lab Isolate" /LENGTH=420 /DNA_ID=CAMNT_0027562237 /DNA_START=8 /DNA_END=1270 /DNA_ORIENTATION=+